jgi:hypothetical protein
MAGESGVAQRVWYADGDADVVKVGETEARGSNRLPRSGRSVRSLQRLTNLFCRSHREADFLL